MNMDFADAMRAAMSLTRDQKLVEATRLIQSALSGGEPVPIRVSERSGGHESSHRKSCHRPCT
jgi:hypothetical protein